MRNLCEKLILTILLSLTIFSLPTNAQKAELVVQTGHTDLVSVIAFSKDGHVFASGSKDKTIKLFDVETGKELRMLTGHTELVFALAFSPDGQILASGSLFEDVVRIWDVATGQELKVLNKHTKGITSLDFSSDGTLLASGSDDGTFIIWDMETKKDLKTFTIKEGAVSSVVFSPIDKNLLVSSGLDGVIRFWDLTIGKETKTFNYETDRIGKMVFSPDGKIIAAAAHEGESIKLWNIESGNLLFTIDKKAEDVSSLSFSPDSKTLAAGNNEFYEKTINFWEVRNGNLLKEIKGEEENIYTVSFSKDGKTIISGGKDGIIKYWDVETSKKIKTIKSNVEVLKIVTISPDGSFIATATDNRNLNIWSIDSETDIAWLAYEKDRNSISGLAFSPDSTKLAVVINSTWVDLIDMETGDTLKTYSLKKTDEKAEILKITPDLDVEKFKPRVVDESGKWRVAIVDLGKVNLIDDSTGRIKATLTFINESDWAVITPDGIFDASPGARKLMHYVIGLEPILLDQMKDIYYVPNLLQKIFRGDPLPKVELFEKKDLFPTVEYESLKPNQKQLSVKLTNRGGGIGQVQVLFNGKELINDARPVGFNPNSPSTVLTVDLSNASIKSGEENKIEIVARNAAGSLSTRGTKGSEIIYLDGGKKQTETPNIYAIVGGTSNYTGDNLKLNFAAKDAEDFAIAIEIGAAKLLGDKSKVHIRLLTSNGNKSTAKFDVPDAKISTSTKADFEKAFADFKGATPNDVFIVYLSGHGVSLNLNQNPNQPAGDTYLYLTQEATTTDKSVLAIENSRRAMAISSEELKDLMKQNNALKQVLILDTCAAGALSNSLVNKRDLPSDQIRAIERLKDNTGFYVLMGSSADAVSYEASQYGQGLLTYSLLQGMKGAKLREDQFADVGLLFGYAQDTVPNMAKNIGGIQRPLIITPDTSASFDIGKFTTDEQKLIQLSNQKPLFLRPNLQNKELDYDNLELTKLLQEKLREANYVSARGENAQLVFVEADEMVDAIKPSGSYSVKGDEITVTIRLIKNKIPIKTLTFTGKTSGKDELVQLIIKGIIESATNN